MMKTWIGRQIARYEHALRRAQLPIWATIAINTFLEVVFDTVELWLVVTIYIIGLFGAVILGYISQKVQVGGEIRKAQWRIEDMPLWFDVLEFSAATYAKYYKMSIEDIDKVIEYYRKKLKG